MAELVSDPEPIRRYMSQGGWAGTEPVHYLSWAVLNEYGSLCGLTGEKHPPNDGPRTLAATSEELAVTCETCKVKLAAIALGASEKAK